MFVRNDGDGRALFATTGSSTASGQAVVGRVTATTPDPDAAGVHGLIAGTGSTGSGVWGSHSGSGAGVYGSSAKGAGVLGTSDSGTGVVAKGNPDALHADGDPSYGTGGVFTGGFYGIIARGDIAAYAQSDDNIGVYGRSVTGTALYGYSNNGEAVVGQVAASSGHAGRFDGPVVVNGALTLNGSLKGCGQGSVNGFVKVDASAGFSSSYTNIATSFNCSFGGAVKARRTSAGKYYVRFEGMNSILATGTVYNSGEDDFLVIDKRLDPLDNKASFLVAVRDADGGTEDRPFTLLAF